jgi:RNA polymerase sigma-70 factor (ECF subfamily)
MKKTIVLAVVAVGALAVLWPSYLQAQTVESVPPVVVKTVPEAGSTNTAPGEMEIKVTFSKEMMDGAWSWANAWGNSTPEGNTRPRYSSDHKTCILKAKLEPGRTYGFWLNSEKFHNFKDKQGRAAVPYLLVFKVKDS